MQQLPLKIQWPLQQRFENFIAGENQASVELLQRIVNGESHHSYILVSGPTGCGKTHLLLALCAAATEKQISAQYFSLSNLPAQKDEVIRNFSGTALICLDDIDAIAGNFSAEHALFDLYNRCRSENTQLVFSAKTVPAQMGLILPDLMSRLSSCTLATIKSLSDVVRRETLHKRALERGIHLEENVLNYLFTHYQRDLGSLFRLLDKLDQLSLAEKRKVTIPFLVKVEKDILFK